MGLQERSFFMNPDIMQNVLYGLEIMWKGMFGIFAVIIVITLIVVLMSKIPDKGANKENK